MSVVMAIGMMSSFSLVFPRAEFLGNNIFGGSWGESSQGEKTQHNITRGSPRRPVGPASAVAFSCQGSSRERRGQGELNYVSRVLWPALAGQLQQGYAVLVKLASHPSSVNDRSTEEAGSVLRPSQCPRNCRFPYVRPVRQGV